MSFSGSAAGASFGVIVLADATAPQREGTFVGLSPEYNRFYVDKSRSTQRNATPPVFKDVMTAPLDGAATELTVFVDGRVVEVFVGGRALTTLVYPSLSSSTQLGLFMRCSQDEASSDASVTASATAWHSAGSRCGSAAALYQQGTVGRQSVPHSPRPLRSAACTPHTPHRSLRTSDQRRLRR